MYIAVLRRVQSQLDRLGGDSQMDAMIASDFAETQPVESDEDSEEDTEPRSDPRDPSFNPDDEEESEVVASTVDPKELRATSRRV
jgi:hypothetical protein